MNKNRAMGISLPIAFYYNYRGRQYREMDVYFSYVPVSRGQCDLLEHGTHRSKGLEHLLKRGSGIFDALVPYKAEKIDRSESVFGSYSSQRRSIGCVDANPTTATISHRQGMMPCTKNNLDTLLGCFAPDYYLCIRDEKLFLRILVDSTYREIPSQPYSHRCSLGFGHKVIRIDGQGLARSFEELNWPELYKDMNDYAVSEGVETLPFLIAS